MKLLFASTLLTGTALAVELAPSQSLEQQFALHRRAISVIEPHLSKDQQTVSIAYLALPVDKLLNNWFGDAWHAPNAQLVFLSRDGYRAVISSSKLEQFHAYLAFAHADGSAFELDNIEQNQQKISLAPYYLIWDNRLHPHLQHQGASGWPYQVYRIELQKTTDQPAWLGGTNKPTPTQLRAFTDTQEHCLTCHQIRGKGGEKYPEDLLQAACRWKDAELNAWIDHPEQLRHGTSMPPLNTRLSVLERQEIITRIIGYLRSMQTGFSACSKDSKH